MSQTMSYQSNHVNQYANSDPKSMIQRSGHTKPSSFQFFNSNNTAHQQPQLAMQMSTSTSYSSKSPHLPTPPPFNVYQPSFNQNHGNQSRSHLSYSNQYNRNKTFTIAGNQTKSNPAKTLKTKPSSASSVSLKNKKTNGKRENDVSPENERDDPTSESAQPLAVQPVVEQQTQVFLLAFFLMC